MKWRENLFVNKECLLRISFFTAYLINARIKVFRSDEWPPKLCIPRRNKSLHDLLNGRKIGLQSLKKWCGERGGSACLFSFILLRRSAPDLTTLPFHFLRKKYVMVIMLTHTQVLFNHVAQLISRNKYMVKKIIIATHTWQTTTDNMLLSALKTFFYICDISMWQGGMQMRVAFNIPLHKKVVKM